VIGAPAVPAERPSRALQTPSGTRPAVRPAAPSPPVADAPGGAAERDVTRLASEINRALRDHGIERVEALVSDDFVATLKGTTTRADQKEAALTLARSFRDLRAVRDQVFVVEP